MTQDEAFVVRYLQKFAGQWVNHCAMLNILGDSKVGYSKGRLYVDRETRRRAWLEMRRAVNSLRKAGVVIRRYLKSDTIGKRGPQMIRLHASFERKTVL